MYKQEEKTWVNKRNNLEYSSLTNKNSFPAKNTRGQLGTGNTWAQSSAGRRT